MFSLTETRPGGIMTDTAVLDFVLHLGNGLGKAFYLFRLLTQQVEHQPQGSLASDAGQLGKLAHGTFQQL